MPYIPTCTHSYDYTFLVFQFFSFLKLESIELATIGVLLEFFFALQEAMSVVAAEKQHFTQWSHERPNE